MHAFGENTDIDGGDTDSLPGTTMSSRSASFSSSLFSSGTGYKEVEVEEEEAGYYNNGYTHDTGMPRASSLTTAAGWGGSTDDDTKVQERMPPKAAKLLGVADL
ncbi:hypothetical protein EV182_008572, partial [Spiromyces aspiralis]